MRRGKLGSETCLVFRYVGSPTFVAGGGRGGGGEVSSATHGRHLSGTYN